MIPPGAMVPWRDRSTARSPDRLYAAIAAHCVAARLRGGKQLAPRPTAPTSMNSRTHPLQRRFYDPGNCECVVVVRDISEGRAASLLSAVGNFRRTPYPGVLVGNFLESLRATRDVRPSEVPVDPRHQFHGQSQSALLRAVHAEPGVFANVEKAVPIDVLLPFERDDVTETLCDALADLSGLVAGRSFHVRARLRGMKGRVEGNAVERALGAYLYELASADGDPPTVSFEDPDVIVVVQVLGCRVGFSFLEREVRSLEIVRPR